MQTFNTSTDYLLDGLNPQNPKTGKDLTEKVNEYYNKSADCDAFVLTMGSLMLYAVLIVSCADFFLTVLDPREKGERFKKYWGDLAEEVYKHIETIVSRPKLTARRSSI